MEEQQKQDLKHLGDHALHGVEDIADVLGHGVAGTVKGVADGIESASAQTQTRKSETDHA